MKPITCAWSPELEDLSQYHKVFPAEQFPALIQELTSIAKLTQVSVGWSERQRTPTFISLT